MGGHCVYVPDSTSLSSPSLLSSPTGLFFFVPWTCKVQSCPWAFAHAVLPTWNDFTLNSQSHLPLIAQVPAQMSPLMTPLLPHDIPLFYFIFYFFWLCHEVWWILVPDQASNPGPQHWKHWALTTGSPGSSQHPPILACALYVFRPNVNLFFNLVLCLPHSKGKLLYILIHRCVPLHWFIQSANIYWAFTMCQAFSRHCRHSNEEIRTDKNLHPQDRRRGLRDTNYYV